MMLSAVCDQLPLFDDEPPTCAHSANLGSVSWSYSRRSTLDRCALQYYFEYFGSNKRTAKTDPAKIELSLLKRVDSRHERTGVILHTAISWYLRETQRGTPPSVERLVEWARRLFQADREYSRQNPDGGGLDKSVRFPPVLLREYHYRLADVEQLCDEVEARLVGALQNFATNKQYREFREAGGWPETLIEYPIRLKRGDLPCRVEGKVDLAYGSAASVTLVDWKLGLGDGAGVDSLQLAVYALWATDHFRCAPESIRICKVHLTSGEIVDFRVDDALLAAARARIVQDALLMNAVRPYGEFGATEAFSPCEQPAVCNNCRFQRVCPTGRNHIRA
jgi:hypothetical protein